MYDSAQLNKLLKARRAQQNKLLREYRFTPNEAEVLISLAEDPRHDKACDISARRGISRSLVCRSVYSLAQKGYLELQTDPEDRRYTHLILSEKARPIIASLRELQSCMSQRLTQGIPEGELNIFEQVLAMMLKNAHAD